STAGSFSSSGGAGELSALRNVRVPRDSCSSVLKSTTSSTWTFCEPRIPSSFLKPTEVVAAVGGRDLSVPLPFPVDPRQDVGRATLQCHCLPTRSPPESGLRWRPRESHPPSQERSASRGSASAGAISGDLPQPPSGWS